MNQRDVAGCISSPNSPQVTSVIFDGPGILVKLQL